MTTDGSRPAVVLGPYEGARPTRPLAEYRRILALTGAGISAGSGLPTFRGRGGLWQDETREALHHAENLPGSASGLWELWGPVREQLRTTPPNAAHVALAALQAKVEAAGGVCQITTMNVDGLHQRAGARDVAELHGSLARTRCADRDCGLPPFEDATAHRVPPPCPRCGGPMIPDVVLYGERPHLDAEWATKKVLRECQLFIAVGTSGVTSPASGYVRYAHDVGARTVLVNLTEHDTPNPYFGAAPPRISSRCCWPTQHRRRNPDRRRRSGLPVPPERRR